MLYNSKSPTFLGCVLRRHVENWNTVSTTAPHPDSRAKCLCSDGRRKYENAVLAILHFIISPGAPAATEIVHFKGAPFTNEEAPALCQRLSAPRAGPSVFAKPAQQSKKASPPVHSSAVGSASTHALLLLRSGGWGCFFPSRGGPPAGAVPREKKTTTEPPSSRTSTARRTAGPPPPPPPPLSTIVPGPSPAPGARSPTRPPSRSLPASPFPYRAART